MSAKEGHLQIFPIDLVMSFSHCHAMILKRYHVLAWSAFLLYIYLMSATVRILDDVSLSHGNNGGSNGSNWCKDRTKAIQLFSTVIFSFTYVENPGM